MSDFKVVLSKVLLAPYYFDEPVFTFLLFGEENHAVFHRQDHMENVAIVVWQLVRFVHILKLQLLPELQINYPPYD